VKSAAGPVLVDGNAPPYSESRQLHTRQPFNPSSTALTAAMKYHGVTVVDTSTPVDTTGIPLFDANGVWTYLCFQ